MSSGPNNPRDHDSIDSFGGGSFLTDCDEVYRFDAKTIASDDDEIYDFETMRERASVDVMNSRFDDSISGIANPWAGSAADSAANSLRNAMHSEMISCKSGDSPASSAFGVGILSVSALCVTCLILVAISKPSVDGQTNFVPDSAQQTIENHGRVANQEIELNFPQEAPTQNCEISIVRPEQTISNETTTNKNLAEVVALYRTGIEHYEAQRYHEAMRSYEAALKLDPSNAIACNNLARARREMSVVLKTAVFWSRFFGEDSECAVTCGAQMAILV